MSAKARIGYASKILESDSSKGFCCQLSQSHHSAEVFSKCGETKTKEMNHIFCWGGDIQSAAFFCCIWGEDKKILSRKHAEFRENLPKKI